MEKERKTVIEVKDAKKVYRMGQEKIKAVDGVSFTVDEGEFCCLLGTSGSGKSTLLNLMAGIEKLTKGEILIKGQSVGKMSENKLAKFRQENLGFVFQSYNLIGSMTALENVEFPLVFKRVPAKKRHKMAVEMLKAVGLKGRMRHKPKEMSGGQQQRVGIARAFVARPAIVFADEPTGNLDSHTTLEVMDMLKAMAKKNNQTVVMVTHDRKLTDYADKIINILDGKIESIEVRERTEQEEPDSAGLLQNTEYTEEGLEVSETGYTAEDMNIPESTGTELAKDPREPEYIEDTGYPDEPERRSGGIDLEYEARKLEEAAQRLIDKEKEKKEGRENETN